MAEYIEREALMKRFCERCNEEMSESPCEPSECFAREVSKTFPAADVAEVRHGEWECGKPCPVCGEDRFKGLDADIWADWEPHYCPNCGAKMDLE